MLNLFVARDRIAETLFSCQLARCHGCDKVKQQFSPEEEEPGREGDGVAASIEKGRKFSSMDDVEEPDSLLFESLRRLQLIGISVETLMMSHHPPISAGHAENEHFAYDVTLKLKTRFLGNSMDVYPVGRCPGNTGEVERKSCNLSKPSDMMSFIANTISGLETHLVQMQTQVTDALQAQLSQTLSQVISQAFSQVSIPPQAAPSTSAQAPHLS
ncbi:hypothetical protein Taro_008943 [Colocasia esculenta]|uniref:Uncharacterized protein n=1 Tax=Colocasia esculenta TaxID=4460 RepID=A0A843TYR8_COLES|nr:hypothetical protein [Colocasia esculenta]